MFSQAETDHQKLIKIVRKNGEVEFLFSKAPIDDDFKHPKVVWANTRLISLGTFIDERGIYGVTQFCYGVMDDYISNLRENIRVMKSIKFKEPYSYPHVLKHEIVSISQRLLEGVRMKNGFHHTEEAIKQRGEVFTPTKLVKQMLGKLPRQCSKTIRKTFLTIAAATVNFCLRCLKPKCLWLKNREGKFFDYFEVSKQALMTIYGCELDSKNAEDCRLNLLKGSHSKNSVPLWTITSSRLTPLTQSTKDGRM